MDKRWTVLLADDEPLVRKGLRKLLDAHRDFVVTSEAVNGREAVEKVSSEKPSLVILDVRMPALDGLDALEKIRTIAPDTVAVVLSGYSDFSYVQRALELGAFDYILKPADPASLIAVLGRAKSRLLKVKRQQQDEQTVKEKLGVSISAYEEQFYQQLLLGRVPDDEFVERLRFLDRSEMQISALLVSLDDMFILQDQNADFDSLFQSLRSCLESELAERCVKAPPVLQMEGGNFVLLYPSACPDITGFAHHLRHTASLACSRSVSVAIGGQVPLSRAAESYAEAKSRLDARFILGSGQVITEEPSQSNIRPEVPLELRKRMQKALRFGDTAQYEQCLRDLFNSFRAQSLSREGWQILAIKVTQQGRDLEEELGLNGQGEKRFLTVGPELAQLTTVPDIQLWITRTMRACIEDIAAQSSGKSIAVRKALAFIADHFAEGIGLAEIASAVGLTTNYVSQLLREETGKTFLTHLSHFRIEASKELLASGKLNVSEIAFKVGYNNPRHFSTMFTRLEGMTPGRFRKGAPEKPGSDTR
jgi:two-component system, response regulator YesN